MEKLVTINIPEDVKYLLKMLIDSGYEAYVVGGAVRDSILGFNPKDYDITTNATPEQMLETFKDFKVIETGLKHGTLTVHYNNENYEITTFRLDGKYSDGRHPDSVTFTDSLKEDLSRRDLTINALAADIEGNIIDYFDGLKDLRCTNAYIRTVGCAEDRYNEDVLRILRTIRFAARYEGEIDDEALKAIKVVAPKINEISIERIISELKLILSTKNCSSYIHLALSVLQYHESFKEIVESLVHSLNYLNMMKALDKGTNYLEKAALLLSASYNKVFTDEISTVNYLKKELKLPAAESKIIAFILCDKSFNSLSLFNNSVKDRKIRIYFSNIMRHLKVNKSSAYSILKYQYFVQRHEQMPEELDEYIRKDLNSNAALILSDLKINGNDLLAIGIPSNLIGLILYDLLTLVLNDPSINYKPELLDTAKNIYDTLGAMKGVK